MEKENWSRHLTESDREQQHKMQSIYYRSIHGNSTGPYEHMAVAKDLENRLERTFCRGAKVTAECQKRVGRIDGF